MFRALVLILGFIFTSQVYSETGTSKDWFWSTEHTDLYFAGTGLDSELALGQYCFIIQKGDYQPGDCVYMVTLGISCEVGNAYPGVINSDKGTVAIKLFCSHKVDNTDGYAMIMINFDDVDSIVRTANKLGIAIPMEGAQFKVVRFSLSGSNHAIESMRAEAANSIERKAPSIKTDSTEVGVQYL